MRNNKLGLLALLVGAGCAGQASAALSEFQTFVGNVGYSSDGFGSNSQSGVISASVPAGSTVLGAYLYTSTFFTLGGGGTLNGSAVAYGPEIPHNSGFLSTRRADVTSIIAPLIDGGPGGVYNFNVTETGNPGDNQNGEALVVVYSNPALAEATFGILDGFSAFAGDSTSINFDAPLDPTAPGFFAEMFLAIGHSCCAQASTVTVNGTVITNSAGNQDDGAQSNGALITVGGFNDPFSPLLPSYADDHERYNLVPYVTAGATSIGVQTVNPSSDDNIFLAGFYVRGRAGINEPPPPPPTDPVTVSEPTSIALLALGGLGLLLSRRRRRAA